MRDSVSATASAAHQPSPWSTTVRQHPLMAIDSPSRAPSATVGASKERRVAEPAWVTERTRPSSSTIPVNIKVTLRVGWR